MWAKLDLFFDVVKGLGSSGGALAGKLESVLGFDLITDILTAGKVGLPKELTGVFWSAVADLFSCRDSEEMSGQVCQATTGTFALGDGETSLTSQVALGDANVHVDAVVL
jgi:hypothetical protein